MYCKLFNCDRRHGSYCCQDCASRAACKNPCQNGPERCGQYMTAEEKEAAKHRARRRTEHP